MQETLPAQYDAWEATRLFTVLKSLAAHQKESSGKRHQANRHPINQERPVGFNFKQPADYRSNHPNRST